jgi:hypothetical protein
MIAYGDRSKYVTSVRIAHPVGGRPSPDRFGPTFTVATECATAAKPRATAKV